MFVSVLLLSIGVLYAALSGGGDDRFSASVVLLLVGLAGIAGVRGVARDTGRPRDALLTGAAILLPAYVALQLVPLPLSLLRLISPSRAALADAVVQATGVAALAPITVSVPTTITALARVAACVTVFLLVRSMAGSPQRRWWSAVPLVAIGAIVAALAFVWGPSQFGFISGAYPNRNHFANLNATILPIAVGYAGVLLYRGRLKGGGAVLLAALPMLCAALMFVAVLFSWSKGGTLALLTSIVAMGLMGIGRRISIAGRTAVAVAAMAVFVVFMLFLTPSGLVERFAVITSNDPTDGRVPIWLDTLHLIAAYPLVGVGLGNFYPTVERFQTSGLSLAWVDAHNDYLQLLTELGIVGAVVPAYLLGTALLRAVRAAVSRAPEEVRFLGLACTGAIAAFLVHSTSEFNSYVLANALTLSWIAGAAAGLRGIDWRPSVGAARQRSGGFASMVVVLLLAGFSAASSIGWLLFLRSSQDDPAAEARFCRFGVCDSTSALDALRAGPDPEVAYPIPVEDMMRYLRRDPAAPDRWEDLGESLQRDGRTVEARFAFDQAITLAPRTPSILLMAADFHFDAGEEGEALTLVSRSLREGSDVDSAVFADLDYRKVAVGSRLEAMPDARAARAQFDWLLDKVNVSDLVVAWSWMQARGYVTAEETNHAVDTLVWKRDPDAALQGWQAYLSKHGASYAPGNAVFDGGFEQEPSGNRFDWRITRIDGVATDADDGVHADGSRALRLRFDGKKNTGELGVQQSVLVAPGRYKFHALVRTESVSTDQGVRFRIASESAPGVAVDTDQLRGTSDWTPIEATVDVPEAARLLRISLVRKPSLKFDSNVAGTAWIDSVSLTRVTQ